MLTKEDRPQPLFCLWRFMVRGRYQRRRGGGQIFQEFKPEVTTEIVERVVHEIDAVVTGVRFAGWQASREVERTVESEIRRVFKKYGLEPTGELFVDGW